MRIVTMYSRIPIRTKGEKMKDQKINIVEGEIVLSDHMVIFDEGEGFLCNLCGYFGSRKEIKHDPVLGSVHWGCSVNYEKDLRSDERVEWEIEKMNEEIQREEN